jgi:DNA mismatch repair protein MutL
MLGKAKNERVAEVNNTIYTVACKAAVKANKRLDEAEIGSLLEQLSRLENPYTCPHGRPSAVKITKYEMEKMFKRIV